MIKYVFPLPLRKTRNHESVNIGYTRPPKTYEFISASYAIRYNRYGAPVAIHNSRLTHNTCKSYCSLHFITFDYPSCK